VNRRIFFAIPLLAAFACGGDKPLIARIDSISAGSAP
jgi:hypothetical protein